MPNLQEGASSIRLAELMAALSLATDLGMGQPLEYELCSCVLAMRLGEALGLSEGELREVYYQALLRFIGCNAETALLASLLGDELSLRADYARIDAGRTAEVVGVVVRHIRQAHAGAPLLIARKVAEGLLSGPKVTREVFAGHCEVAQRLAARLGFSDTIIRALGQLFERWDGRGQPGGLKGEEIALSVRVVMLAQDAITFHRLGGSEAAVAMARERKGGVYDPRMVECFCRRAASLLAGLDDEPSWAAVLALEPGVRVYLSDEQFETACQAIADFADLKSPSTLGHSPGVAELAAGAASHCGLLEADVVTIRRAGLLHDVGRARRLHSHLDKAWPLSEREWEQVRLHPYYTERVLARPAQLARLGVFWPPPMSTRP